MNSLSRFLGATAALSSFLSLASCGGSNASPTAVPTAPVIPITTRGNYVWELNSENDLRTATIDVNGKIGSPVEAGGPVSNSQAGTPTVAVDPAGHFLFALDTTINQVRVFSISGPGVKLTEVAGSPFAPFTPGRLQALLIGPKGNRLYILQSPSTIQGFDVNAQTGKLTIPTWVSVGIDGRTFEGIAMTPSGVFLYTNDFAAGQIYAFNITDDRFLQIPGSAPVFVPSGGEPTHLVVDSSGKYLYATLAAWRDLRSIKAPASLPVWLARLFPHRIFLSQSPSLQLADLCTSRIRMEQSTVSGSSWGQVTWR
jgi:DNA-binding beta-propeller fold protein YncE